MALIEEMVHKITQLGAVLVCCLIDSAAGYLQGAPSSVCNTKDMKPQHNTEYNVNNNTAEYVLDVSATEYDPTDSSKSSKFMCLVKRQSSVAKMMRSL